MTIFSSQEFPFSHLANKEIGTSQQPLTQSSEVLNEAPTKPVLSMKKVNDTILISEVCRHLATGNHIPTLVNKATSSWMLLSSLIVLQGNFFIHGPGVFCLALPRAL